ncbi:MAG: DsbA family protein [Gammaproteobacteria bacterium]|nr:DsbA family protein [Gammaproteobacteria bacterium]
MTDTLAIDVFWSFRSPWSYLATPRLAQWQRDYDLDVRFRPVYPIAVRTPEFFQQVHPLWFSYFFKDVFRVAEFLGIPFQWANPDPIIQELGEDGRPRTAAEQPYIQRLTRLGVLAEERGRGIEFAEQISTLIWTTEGWNEGEHMAKAAQRASLDLTELDAAAAAEAERIEAVISKNEADHEAAGHWGVPTCVFQGEPFFGQDRLDVLLWRLRQHGLKERG